LPTVTDRPTGDLTIVCTDALNNVDDVCLTTANNVTASDYTVSTVSSDMGRALSAFYVVNPNVGLDEVAAARAQDRDSVFDSQSAAADSEVKLISGPMHNSTSVGGPTVTDRFPPTLLTPRHFSYWSSGAPSRQSVQSVYSRHSVSSRVQDPMFDFMNNFTKSLLDEAARRKAHATRREAEAKVETREKMKLKMQLQQLQQQLAMRTPIGAMSVSVFAPSVSVATLSAAPMTATVIETDNTDDVVTQPVSGTGNVSIGSATQAPVDVNIGQSVGLTVYPSADRMYTMSFPANRTNTSKQVNAPTYTTTAVGLVTDTQVQPAAVAASSSITGVQPQGTGISGRAVVCTSVVSTRPGDTQPQDTGLIQLPPATGLSPAAAQPPPSSVFGSNVAVLDE